MIALVLVALVAAVAVGWVVLHNGLVTRRNGFRNAFGQIDVQLQRRYDLIPNLVEATRAYLAHERSTLEAVIAARNQAVAAARAAAAHPGEAASMERLAQAEGALAGPLSRLLAVAEAYPDLKASDTVGRLVEELTSTENRVAFARQAYNDAVMSYNNARETFPGTIVAGGFPEARPLEIASPQAREPVRIAL
jgi:LemA protein